MPIGTGPSQNFCTMLRVVVPVQAGDVLDVSARTEVTNNTSPGYTVGIGYHLWEYDLDNGLWPHGTWVRISPYIGDNVSRDRHHIPIVTDGVWQVPSDWPAGHRIVIVFRAEAMSTAADGQSVIAEQATGNLTVRKYPSGTLA